MIFSRTEAKSAVYSKLARWYNQLTVFRLISYNTIFGALYTHCSRILNFFKDRSTNASVENYKAKLRAFLTCLRGVCENTFFLLRYAKIFEYKTISTVTINYSYVYNSKITFLC